MKEGDTGPELPSSELCSRFKVFFWESNLSKLCSNVYEPNPRMTMLLTIQK